MKVSPKNAHNQLLKINIDRVVLRAIKKNLANDPKYNFM
ncbi:hypothetical protein PRO82_001569 [Candidatus Protochlamydia amoebophila]|nr:hypothetical protein [Candidatus Protochlamydia amoebophila]